MSKAKHTPGPWEAHETDDGHQIRMAEALDRHDRFPIQQVIEYEHGLCHESDGSPEDAQYEEAEANALLIAAAPDLLAACKAVLAHWGCSEREARPLGEQLTAAIARAEGGGS